MSTGFDDQLADELGMRRGLSSGGQVPLQRLDLNFAESGMGGAFSNPLTPFIVQPMINSFFNQGGMMPAQFFPQQSVFSQWQAKQYWQARQAAMATASQADRETYVQMLRGMAQLKGTPWGLEQQRGANIMAGDMAYMAPFLAQAMPETFDTLHGSRGSATVMASFLHRGGLLGVDPVTGRTGISGTSSGVLAAEMHRRFFGADTDLSGWRGISAGRAGAMYDELQTRGLMDMSIGAMTPAEKTAALTGTMTSRQDILRMVQEKTPGAFKGLADTARTSDIATMAAMPGLAEQALRGLDPTNMDAVLRQFDANKIGNTLKNMSGAVAAMREIFGDMGRPNAPMSQLIEGLNKLTSGGLATMNPAELEQTVRNTQVIARTSGLGMTALAGLTAQGSATATKMGLNERFGLISAQGAAEFGAAYGQVGQANLGGWGRVDRDKITLLDQQLRLNAAASPMATRLGAAMQIYETMGAAAAGTPLAAMAKAIQSGASEFEVAPGQMQSLNMGEARWREIMGLSRADPGLTNMILRSPAGVQQQIAKYGITDIARRANPDDIRDMTSQHLREAVSVHLAESGLTGDRAESITGVATGAMAEALLKMDPSIRTVDKSRNAAMGSAVRTAVVAQFRSQGMTAEAASAEFDRLFPETQLNMMGTAGWSRIQQRIARDPAWNYGSANTMYDLNNDRVQRQSRVLARERASQVALGTQLGGLGTAGPIARIMNVIQGGKGSISEAIHEVMGGQSVEEIRKRLGDVDLNSLDAAGGLGAADRTKVLMSELMTTVDAYRKVEADAGTTPEAKAAANKVNLEYMAALRGGSEKTAPMLRASLLAHGHIKEGDSAERVREVAKEVMSGKRGTKELREKIQGLAVAGGLVDTKAIRAAQEKILEGAGIKPADFDSALYGEMRAALDPKVNDALLKAAAAGGGLDEAAAGVGGRVGAVVGEAAMTDVVTQRALLESKLGIKDPAKGPELDALVAKRKEYAESSYKRGSGQINALMGDPAAMENLGRGGFALAQTSLKNYQRMAFLANKHGLSMTDVLARAVDMTTLSDEQKKAVIEIRGLDIKANEANAKMAKQFAGPHVAMTAAEKAEYDKFHKDYIRSDADKNKDLVTRIMSEMKLEEGERTGIEGALGKGDEAAARRAALSVGLAARKDLQAMAGAAGVSVLQLQKNLDSGKLGATDATKARTLFDTAGKLADSDSAANIRGFLDVSDAKRAEATSKEKAGAGGPTKMTIDGKLDVATGAVTGTATTMSSTPTGH